MDDEHLDVLRREIDGLREVTAKQETEIALASELEHTLEQMWMVAKDQYGELARALGTPGDAWFGDPLESHAEVLARARRETDRCHETARQLGAAEYNRDRYRDALAKIRDIAANGTRNTAAWQEVLIIATNALI